MPRKKKEMTERECIDWWLKKYHNTTLKDVEDTHPEWLKDPQKHTRDFYEAYAVTQEQHDEWHEWFLSEVMKRFKYSKKLARRRTAFDYLNVSPSIKQNQS